MLLTTRLRRLPGLALPLAGLLLLGACSSVDAPVYQARVASATSGPVDGKEPAEAAGDWLTRQLREGVVRDQERDREDLGQTIDIGLAYVQAGDRRQAVRAIAEAVAERRDAYVRPDGPGTPELPGPAAQSLVLLQQARADVGTLPRVLERLASTDPAFPGRLRNSTIDDTDDVVGQAYGARALVDAGSDRAADVAAFLLSQQCADGFFRAGFSSLTSTTQTCDGGRGGRPDVQTTAQVLLLMAPVTQQFAGGREAMRRAAGWLAERQGDDGTFAPTLRGDPDAVTTGLVTRALGTWGDTDAAEAGAAAIAPLQLDRGNDAGAVASTRADLDRAEGGSLGVPPPTSWRRATTQAVAALAWLD